MDPSPHPSLHVWSGTNFYLSEHSGSSAMLIFSPLTCPLEWSHWSANCRAGRASDPDPALVSISFYNTLQASNPCDWFLPPTFWNWEILLETVQSTLLLSFSHQKAGTSWEQGSLVSLADTQPDMYTNRILHSPPPQQPTANLSYWWHEENHHLPIWKLNVGSWFRFLCLLVGFWWDKFPQNLHEDLICLLVKKK